jgi:ferredoxin
MSAPRPAVLVDPVACDGVGICAHLAPDLIRSDSWGYPVVTGRPGSPAQVRQAARAAAACPRKALLLVDRQP